MRPEIKTSHQVVNAKWCESRGEWELQIKDLIKSEIFTDRCEFLLIATGILK